VKPKIFASVLSERIGVDFERIQGVSQLLKQSDWAQIQDFK